MDGQQILILVSIFACIAAIIGELFKPRHYAFAQMKQPEKVLTEDRNATYYKGKGSPRDPIPKDMIIAIFERDGGKCVHCGANCYLGSRKQQDISQGLRKAYLGHWIANAIGGVEEMGNLHISCDDCNKEMGSDLILAPAIRFAASRKETICTEGLTVAADCETIIEYQSMKVAA